MTSDLLPAARVEAHSARFHPLWTETVRLMSQHGQQNEGASANEFCKILQTVRHKELYGVKKPENPDHRLKADLKA